MPSFTPVTVLSLLLAAAGWAHEPFESTAVARLQHGRLEVVLTMTTELGGALVSGLDSGGAPAWSAATFPEFRERLENRARLLYEVTAGGTVLASQRTAARLAEGGHVEIALIYPRPPAWPLRFRSRAVEMLPPSYTADFEVFDEEEKRLGRKFFTAQKGASAELSIAQNAAPLTAASPAWMAPTAPAPAEPIAPAIAAMHEPVSRRWLLAGVVIAFLMAKAGLVLCRVPKPPDSMS